MDVQKLIEVLEGTKISVVLKMAVDALKAQQAEKEALRAELETLRAELDKTTECLIAEQKMREAYREVAIQLTGSVDCGPVWDVKDVDAEAKRLFDEARKSEGEEKKAFGCDHDGPICKA